MKDLEVFIKKENLKKCDNMAVNNTKIFEKTKNKSLLIIEKISNEKNY